MSGSASPYESLGSQFFRTTTGIESGLDAFDESRFIMIFLTVLGVTEILCSFRLVLEGKTGTWVIKIWVLRKVLNYSLFILPLIASFSFVTLKRFLVLLIVLSSIFLFGLKRFFTYSVMFVIYSFYLFQDLFSFFNLFGCFMPLKFCLSFFLEHFAISAFCQGLWFSFLTVETTCFT